MLSFFYTSSSIRRYFEIGKCKFSLDYDCAQEAEFSSAHDVCHVIEKYLVSTKIESAKPYLLIVNPRSGTRKGLKIFNNCISELFERCHIKYELLMTERALHARNFIKSSETLSQYRGIVTVSGDGLIYEVFCGIMARESWREDIESTPVSVIPAGSGNGLAASLCAFSGVNPRGHIMLYNTLLLTNPKIQLLDLMRVQTFTGDQFPAFLSLTWGLMAHVDVGSEKLRWMGPARFTLVAILQVAKMNKYKGKLWYQPAYSDNSKQHAGEAYLPQHCGEKGENCSFANSPFRYLPDISQSIPDDGKWVLLDQTFISVIITLLPYLATDVKMAPDAKINDGKIHIIVINPDISRTELLNCINSLETGGHLNCKSISYIECVAFRLVPECDKCYMAVDGECVPNTAIQAEIMASVARTFTGPNAGTETVIR